MTKNIIGIDLGATSGRVILATLGDGDLKMEELVRFPNKIIESNGRNYWDIYELFEQIKLGLVAAGKKGVKIDSIGVDTWGVDFVYVGEDGSFMGLPRAYRDPYTNGAPEEFFKIVPKEKVYDKTGIQIMNFNSLYQLYAANRDKSSALKAAKKILFMPDAISYMLTGKMVCEYTILSTSQFLDPRTKKVDEELLKAAGVSADLIPEIVMPGHLIGKLSKSLAEETGLGEVAVVAVAGHDTGSAVAAVPATDENYAYLSSGTWSLMGIEVRDAIINKDSYEMNFTNEGGIEGTTRFLKNITGMWLLERCRAEWAKDGKNYSYPEIVQMTKDAAPLKSFVDSDDPSFANPASMIKAIKDFCVSKGLPAPQTDAEMMRCIFDSLALKYRFVLERLKKVAPFEIKRLHIIGGGAQNDLLNQFTSNSIGLPVSAGPAEATTLGNVMVQARNLGVVNSIGDMRKYISKSVELKEYTPKDNGEWSAAYAIFEKFC